MKKITAIIHAHKLNDVQSSLITSGVIGMTVTEIKNYGHNKGSISRYRGTEYRVEFGIKTKIEVIVEAELADLVAQEISLAGRTGEIGDGKIFIEEVEQVVRIRTKETGITAI